MADHSLIEWTDATWNPITGCSVVSPGCTNCYAMKLAGTRLQHHPSRVGLTRDSKAGPIWTGEVRLNEQWLDQPLRWKAPRRIFVCAHGDLFAENVPDEWIDRVFAVMALAPQHTFQVLTKRSTRMRSYVTALDREPIRDTIRRMAKAIPSPMPKFESILVPPPNVWLGVSTEDQKRADERIPDLLATPAAVRFVSAEPLLSPIDFRQWQHDYGCGCGWGGDTPLDYCNNCGWRGHAPGEIGKAKCRDCNELISDYNACPECDGHDGDDMTFGPNSRPRLDWIIVGGESGHGARPMHPEWVRSLRDQCAAADTAFFFKQWGQWVTEDQSPETIILPGESRGAWAVRDADGCWGGDQTQVYNVGKKRAGRLLDGIEHNAMPEAA